MRVAAIYDIHGNLPALEAVLSDIRKIGVDRVVVGGDVVPGPMCRDCLTMLLELDIPVQFIQGNCEREVLAELAGGSQSRLPERVRATLRWTAQHLQPDYTPVLGSWPKTLRLTIPGVGEVLFCHATPRNDNEIFTSRTADDRLVPVFQGVDVSVVVCGHTHMQSDRRIAGVRVVNAGSVGMPFGEPGAYWLLLGPDVRLQRTEYDLARAAARVRATPYPEAEDFAANNVLRPPSEQAMLDAFSKAELTSAG
jgi:putative phosphoesterase